ncbi:hypothetical protein [Porphyrobacter sp. AAP82]|uniref:hypothetical protein n=1 Tax=Porphyrobacter sp. AAP82 TaxID=1248917 RepID=UPI0012DCB66B|nr:hypothetical protein [Porphyrobacter sp. AAP82]
MGHWASKKIVVRDFYISFKPMGADPNSRFIDLSDPIANQASDEAIYVAVTGRPAGLWNFIREHVGLSRRFEFVMSSSQCIQRLGSPTTQILSSSRIDGLNTITVGLVRPLVQAIIFGLLSLGLVIAASHKPDLAGMGALSAAEAAAEADYESDSGYADGGASDARTDETGMVPEFEEPSTFGMTLSLVNMVLLGIAPAWVWFMIALGLGLYAAYLFFIDKRNLVTVSESGDPVVGFIVSPSFLESQSTDIPLSELNKLPMIFRVLKDK